MGLPRPHRRVRGVRGRLPVLLSVLVSLTLAVSCSALGPNRESPAPRPPWPSTSASVSMEERPVKPVPAVQPAGFAEPPPGRGLERYADQQVRWEPCKDGLQCADVLVPLDYAKPDGTAISLALARKPATGTRNLGSLFINPGGPGISGVSYVSYFNRSGLEDYDIVGWDPRGVAGSTPVQCVDSDVLDQYTAMDVSPDSAAEKTALIQANREFGVSCLARSGPLLQHVSTIETARDLDLLRRMLGNAPLRYFGSSYGTQIGAHYAQLFPKAVGRMVLDGAVDLTGDSGTSQAEGFEKALRTFAQWCADRQCSLGSNADKVEAAVVDLWTRLDGTPMQVGQRELSQQLAVTAVIFVLYENDKAWTYLLKSLEAAIQDGDGRTLLDLADQYNQRQPNGQYGQFNYSFPAIRCLDTDDGGIRDADRDAARTVKDAPTIGPFLGPNYLCPMWPVPAAPRPAKVTGPGAAPIVVVGTTGDPATPYENAVGMARQLESAVLITFTGEGHLAYGQSPCVQRLVRAYLVDGVVPADGSRC
jgi:pimeloyl-ACP methyl ester carboxylesterase